MKRKIINELKIDDDVPLSRRTNDFILRSKISTRLLFKSGINSNNFSVDVVDGEVYIIGLADNINENIFWERLISDILLLCWPPLLTLFPEFFL